MLLLRSPYTQSDDSFNHFLSELCAPSYLNRFDNNSFNFSDTIGDIVNDDSKFSLQIDVSQFKPENLKIELNGRQLKIEGEQKTKSEKHGYSKKSFSRMVVLPDDTDVTAIKSAVSNDGKLQFEAPKKTNTSRSIPINFVQQH